MPLRHMLYDSLQYYSQWQGLKREHRKKKDLCGAEYLSGFSSEDRLIPVITLCVYWGTEPWTGPKNLHEMLDIPPQLEHHKDRLIGNYPLNLLEIQDIPDLDQYEGDLKALFGFLKHQEDQIALKSFIAKNDALFHDINDETTQAISILGNIKNLNQYLKTNNNKTQNGGTDMCKAIDDMINDSKQDGILIGIHALIEDNLEDGKSKEQILEKLQKHFQLTPEQAMEHFAKYE